MISGGIGAATGLWALWMSAQNSKRLENLERIDRRYDARRLYDELDQLFLTTAEMLPTAFISHQRNASAGGSLHSGAMDLFVENHAEDTAILNGLMDSYQNLDQATFDTLDEQSLSDLVLELQRTKDTVASIASKYREFMESDRRDVDRRRSKGRP